MVNGKDGIYIPSNELFCWGGGLWERLILETMLLSAI